MTTFFYHDRCTAVCNSILLNVRLWISFFRVHYFGGRIYIICLFSMCDIFFYKLFFPFNKRIYIDICISKLYALSFVRINATNLKQFSKNVRIYSIISFYEDADIDDIGADGGCHCCCKNGIFPYLRIIYNKLRSRRIWTEIGT